MPAPGLTDSSAAGGQPLPFGDCGDRATRIHAVQGSGSLSPRIGDVLVVEGVVVAAHQGAGALGGFFLQEEDDQTDTDPSTSEGLFVFDGGFGVSVAVGQVVRVRGTVTEFATGSADLTELTNLLDLKVCEAGRGVAPAEVALPVAELADWERYEGMLVKIRQRLVVTDVFSLARFGELSLAPHRLWQPTLSEWPGPAALARQSRNDRSRLLLDDASAQQRVDPVRYPPPDGLSATNTLRVGDAVSNGPPGAPPALTAVLDHRFDAYRLQPVDPAALRFTPSNPRPAAPPPVGGTLRVVSFNLLNYFTTLDTGAAACGPAVDLACRGARSALERSRQRDKLLSAMHSLDADVFGLVELENNAAASLRDLMEGLNARAAPGAYAFLNTGTIGHDAIKVGLIYRPAAVTPWGVSAILDNSVDLRAIATRNRPVLAQTFRDNASGEVFTVVVTHFKSKASACDVALAPGELVDPDALDGQGNCNRTRTSMAHALVDWLATDPTHSDDPDVLILGDLNAYAREDPVRALEHAGYSNLIQRHLGEHAYSFVFQGQSGYLDHALASASLVGQVTGVSTWHINADEPAALDYRIDGKTAGQLDRFYRPDPYRSSDHDPLLIGLELKSERSRR
jgi:predicted extracellular nuclease